MEKTDSKTKKKLSSENFKNLIIVESPTKARTISGMLDKNFKVESSYGHVRDLPKSKLGIDTEKNFAPQYIIPKKSQKTVSQLKKLAEKSDTVILATDEDREGEAIAWHLAYALELKKQPSLKNKEPVSIQRIVFHEITKKAIEEALKNPRDINIDLVNAQQARRVLDRLVGYKLSPFLWKKVMSKLSAGRVQSATLRLIVDREREIEAFKPQKYYSILARLKELENNEIFSSMLYAVNGKSIPNPGILDKKEADEITENLKKSNWHINSIAKKEKLKKPNPPFTTSTLQQSSWNQLKFSAKKTMMFAQQLYEGIEIKGKGRVGLITYMRTDSLNLSEEAISNAREYISGAFGNEYLADTPRKFKTKSKNAQEAHEAIRPTDARLAPEKIKDSLTPDQYKLYKLIWQRFAATQMKEAKFEETTAEIKADKEKNSYSFKSKGLTLKFDGFLKVYPMKIEEELLPPLSKDYPLSLIKLETGEHETKPPARYNEASLIKTLEKFGIGRPSTYAPTIATIQERGYVIKNANKNLEPAEIGIKVTDLLKEHFQNIVDINFTAQMEADLDEIANGKKEWQPVIKDFYFPFEKNLEKKYQEVQKQEMPQEETGELCDKCGKPMIIKLGRFGKFAACSGFPECKNTKTISKPLNIKCPKCKEGDIVERKAKKTRKVFYGCSKYPSCDFSSWEKPKEIQLDN